MDDLARRGGHLSAKGSHQSHAGWAEDGGTLSNGEDRGVGGVRFNMQSRAKEKWATRAAHR
jgi:hypothetical protein